MKLIGISLAFLLIYTMPEFVNGQKIDNTASYRRINNEKYFRFHYDNDFFTATDQYYTQGINLEFVHPSLKNFPFSKLLFHFSGKTQFGISVEHNSFTPSSIRHNEIILDDHPFTASIMLKTFAMSTDSSRRQYINSVFTVGAIGPAAFGEDMQKSIHRWLKNIEPLGWSHQIKNDVIVNYELCYGKYFYEINNVFSLDAISQIDIGTLNDRAMIGLTITGGKFNSIFSDDQKFQFYVYCRPQLNFVVYDATLQGGLFNDNNPYVIYFDKISRLIFEDNFGVVLTINKIYLEYYQTFSTKEFETGTKHRWGGIRVGMGF